MHEVAVAVVPGFRYKVDVESFHSAIPRRFVLDCSKTTLLADEATLVSVALEDVVTMAI